VDAEMVEEVELGTASELSASSGGVSGIDANAGDKPNNVAARRAFGRTAERIGFRD
jgi:hypothetical protein